MVGLGDNDKRDVSHVVTRFARRHLAMILRSEGDELGTAVCGL
jgi:hypothetical protein